MTDSACSECGERFSCGGCSGSCWCQEYPPIMPADFTRDCRCPRCLAKAVAAEIESRLATLPHGEALRMATGQAPSLRVIEHIDYTQENGTIVFTKWYLLKQGFCCGNGCRNCPYPASEKPVEANPPHILP